MIVDGLDTTKSYSADEVLAMKDDGRLRNVTMKGWFFRFDLAKNAMTMVHVTDPTANRMAPGSTGGRRRRGFVVADPLPNMKEAVEREHPIVKRTPQERLAAMTSKMMQGERGQDGAARMLIDMLSGHGGGNMDAMTEDQVKQITGVSWKEGDPIDADVVRRVAARYLGQAERKVAEQASDTRTRAGRKARKEQERLERVEAEKFERRRKAAEANHENAKTLY